MGLENAEYIDELVETNPTGSDTQRQGDDHIRMLKGILVKTFPGFDTALTATPTQINDIIDNSRVVLAKMIVAFYGDETEVPDGWSVCNGTNGTPDLRDKFLMCAGPKNDHLSRGGGNDIDIEFSTEETILTTAQIPKHTHTVNVDHKNNVATNTGGQRCGNDGNADHAIDLTSSEAGSDKGHKHLVKLEQEEGNMPAFLSLLYIMKLT